MPAAVEKENAGSMSMLASLAEMTALASAASPLDALARIRELLRVGLRARDVAFVFGDESDGFARICGEPLPDNGVLWVIHRKVTDAGHPQAFEFVDGRARHFQSLDVTSPITAFAARPTASMLGAEMVVVRGDWPAGLGEDCYRFFEAALAPATIALQRMLEDRRAQRDNEQVSALSEIARLLSETESIDDVLTKLCTILAGVSDMTSVTIDVLDPNEGMMVRRAMNNMGVRTANGERWIAAVRRPNPIQEEAFRTRRSVLLPDLQNDPRVDERSRQFFRNSLIRSAAVVPLFAQAEAVGCISFASNRPQSFENRGFLEGLASQAAMAVKAVQMYHALAASRRELKELNERLLESMRTEHHLARTDSLTGMPNRRYIDEVLHAECERARTNRSPLSIAMADIDHFKEINDTYGHDAGDEILRQVGALARRAGGERHVAGRYGGDEFIFVMPALCLTHASETAEELHQLIGTHDFWIDRERRTPLTISVGVAGGCADDVEDVESLVHLADTALYSAKRAGRNRVKVFESEAPRRAA